MSWARRALLVAGVAGLAAAARGPLHLASFGLPVSNDDAILLLMARHVRHGELATTLWNQPYNGALDAYLLAPFVTLLGSHDGYRLYQVVCGALFVLCAGLLARRTAGTTAGWFAAALAACGTPYMVLMTATGPPPNFLMPLVTGFPLLAGLRALDPEASSRPSAPALAGLGLVCGLAVWNSSLAIPAFFGMAVGLALAGLRPRRAWLAGLAGFGLGVCPLLVARLVGASGSRVVTAASAVTAVRPPWLWAQGLGDLARALAGLVGLQVPLVVDGAERGALPIALAVVLATALVALCVGGIAVSRRAWPLALWALALAGAFALSRRTGPNELRYLYGLQLPLIALCGAGLSSVWRRRPALAVAGGLALLPPWAWGQRVEARAWRDPLHAMRVWEVPSLAPVLDTLRRAHVESAYASLQFAGRLTLESEERVIASQAWNERIPGDPLRFRDEVDLDPTPAWMLSPHYSRGMPRAGAFRSLLRELGGTWREDLAGDFVVFRRFVPPYDEARPVPAAALRVATLDGTTLPRAVLDRDAATWWSGPSGLARGRGLVVSLTPARRLSAVVLALDLEASPLAVPWVAEAGGEIVARGPFRHGLQWLNGAPRAGKQALLVVPFEGRVAGEVRLIFQGAGPVLRLCEVFAYGPDETSTPSAGAAAAKLALSRARAGDWDGAVRSYLEAYEADPERASYLACLARARWRAAGRRWLDVESLDDGGPELVGAR